MLLPEVPVLLEAVDTVAAAVEFCGVVAAPVVATVGLLSVAGTKLEFCWLVLCRFLLPSDRLLTFI